MNLTVPFFPTALSFLLVKLPKYPCILYFVFCILYFVFLLQDICINSRSKVLHKFLTAIASCFPWIRYQDPNEAGLEEDAQQGFKIHSSQFISHKLGSVKYNSPICGSSFCPQKRWSSPGWRFLHERVPTNHGFLTVNTTYRYRAQHVSFHELPITICINKVRLEFWVCR